VLEAFAQPGVAGRRPAQHCQGDDAIEADVAGAIDLAHAAGAEGFENLVGTEFVPDWKRGRAGIERDTVRVKRGNLGRTFEEAVRPFVGCQQRFELPAERRIGARGRRHEASPLAGRQRDGLGEHLLQALAAILGHPLPRAGDENRRGRPMCRPQGWGGHPSTRSS
jgi:hypothetical protein